ncbi:23S rRNA (pseudouridine(1915)-N(3))-methyltransferase RlmH [Shouchella patagoniensis]|uniref:23S rRNA (pseudouridine(1915)-N(3))-methyltransferase RlmH n=1 Tax=Shouchella patagoniensis TaxID=228576 RepID=UPI000995A014|nr:23S rRNA (pseudouridine(1915)-N(3))-methyltransferase RlmH [Shouchella patagoniensis]
MNITFLTVGKLKEKYLKQGMEEYKKRLGAYAKIQEIEVPDEKAPENLSEEDMRIVKKKEGERILAKLNADAYVIALAIEGQMKTSEQLAKGIEQLGIHGKSKVVFIIGGSLGLADEVYDRADELLSFSKMTFPHQLMKLVLMEQVYRSFRIMRGEPYHK